MKKTLTHRFGTALQMLFVFLSSSFLASANTPVAEILNKSPYACGASVVLRTTITPYPKKWTDMATGQTLGTGQNLTVSQTGTYIFTVTANIGGVVCSAADTVSLIQFNAAPTVAATGGQITCSNTAVALDCSFSGTAAPVFRWSGPGGYVSDLKNPMVVVPGGYKLTITAPENGCTAKATTTVTKGPGVPGVNIQSFSGDTLTCDIPGIDLYVTVSGANDFDIVWDGTGLFSGSFDYAYVESAGYFTATAINFETNCTGTDAFSIYANNEPPQISISEGFVGCNNLLDTLVATVVSGPGALDFFWDGPSANPDGAVCYVDYPGEYYLAVTNFNTGCYAEATVLVHEIPGSVPGVAEVGWVLDCLNPETQVFAYCDLGAPEYSWAGPNNFTSDQPDIFVTEPGIYAVTMSEGLCTATATVTVEQDISTPVLSIDGQDSLDCNNETLVLTAVSASPDVEIAWFDESGGVIEVAENVEIGTAGTYQVVATSFVNGCSSTESVVISEDFTAPNLILDNVTLDCANPSAAIPCEVSGHPAVFSFEWSGPSVSQPNVQNPTVVQPGIYAVVAVGINGCASEGSVEVLEDFAAPTVSATGGILTCTVTSVVLETTIAPTGQTTIVWTGPDGSQSTDEDPIASLPGTYQFLVTAANGCTTSGSVEVVDSCVMRLFPEIGFENSGLKIYPSLSNGPLTLETVSGQAIEFVRIFDAAGREVFRSETPGSEIFSLDLSGFPLGQYSVFAVLGGGRLAGGRFVIF